MRCCLALFFFLVLNATTFACEGIATTVAGAAACLKPGDTFKDCPDCPEMTVIPPGKFQMGAALGNRAISADASPAHAVTIPQALAVGTFEITRGQYKAFAKASGFDDTKYWKNCTTLAFAGFGKSVGKTWKDPGFDQDDNHPVVCISWEAASKYAAWLSEKTGATYRMLSEAEWEYAARAGSTTLFSFNDTKELYCDHMNLADKTAAKNAIIAVNYKRYSSPHHNCDDGYAFTAPVGSYKASPFGLHDMHGNVFEWVEDCYIASYVGAPDDGSARTGKANCEHVMRGGGWYWHDLYQAAPKRKGAVALSDDRGFRIARDVASGSWWKW